MSEEQKNPFDDESLEFFILINATQQYSLWPAFVAVPDGWKKVIGPESRSACIDYVDKHWKDIRPKASVVL
jgi:MbtH protein